MCYTHVASLLITEIRRADRTVIRVQIIHRDGFFDRYWVCVLFICLYKNFDLFFCFRFFISFN
jgi:hypothetical protein